MEYFQKTMLTYSSNPVTSFVLDVVINEDYLIKYSKIKYKALISFKLKINAEILLFHNAIKDKTLITIFVL